MSAQDAEAPDVVTSELDEATHAELRLLYEESTRILLFAKAQQWKTLGVTLLVFAGLIVMADYISNNTLFVRIVVGSIFLISIGAIYTLVLYQFWQNTERAKLRSIAQYFSSVFKDIRAVKSSDEANLHRYILLSFMIISIVLGNAAVILSLWRLYR